MAENDVQDGTPQAIDNFVKSLSPELQGIMQAGSPPQAVDAIIQVANTLDPDLAAAFNAGNPSIIQAVKAGMTTTSMVVNELVRLGISPAGLPEGVRQLVQQQKDKAAEEREMENEGHKDRLRGLFGLALGAMGLAPMANGARSSEGTTQEGGRKAAIRIAKSLDREHDIC